MLEQKITENSTNITEYTLLSELPDPFLFDDGTRVKTKEDWQKRRKEMYKDVIEFQYGTMPPEPEFLDVELLCLCSGRPNTYRITTGTRKNPITFNMYVFKASAKKTPMVITGDMCFHYPFNREYINAFIQNGVGLVLFNRTELAPDSAEYNINAMLDGTYEKELAQKTLDDMVNSNTCTGSLKKTYPEYTFGNVGAWAWGYSRCVDALEKLGIADMIAFTGHSRGGKACALAGALDERAVVVNPNASCSGGYGSYRIKIKAKVSDGTIKESEPLSNIYHWFPTWLGAGMKDYIDKEGELSFDSHHLKAMVAPRTLFVSEAAEDIMGNPVGSYQTTEAAAEVFDFLDCPENLIWYFRGGTHFQTVEDVSQLVNVIRHKKYGEPLNEKFFKLPFKKMKPAYSWKAPTK